MDLMGVTSWALKSDAGRQLHTSVRFKTSELPLQVVQWDTKFQDT